MPVGGIGVGRLALVGVAAMAVACASGGGSARMTVAEAEALLGQVREVLEVVDGRLKMTRTIRVLGETVVPLVLVYDREGGS